MRSIRFGEGIPLLAHFPSAKRELMLPERLAAGFDTPGSADLQLPCFKLHPIESRKHHEVN
jgi:hypothetical protein